MQEQFFSNLRRDDKSNLSLKVDNLLAHLEQKFKGNILEYLKIDKKKFTSSVRSLIEGVQAIPLENQKLVHVAMQEYFSDAFSTLPDGYSTVIFSGDTSNDQDFQIFLDVGIEAAIFLKLRAFASLYAKENILYLGGKDCLFELNTIPIAMNYPKTYILLEENFLYCQKLLAVPVDPAINVELDLEENTLDEEIQVFIKKFDKNLYGRDALLSVGKRQQRLLGAYGLLVHSQEQSIIEVIEDIDNKAEHYSIGIKIAIIKPFIEYACTSDQAQVKFLENLSIALEEKNIASTNECTVM